MIFSLLMCSFYLAINVTITFWKFIQETLRFKITLALVFVYGTGTLMDLNYKHLPEFLITDAFGLISLLILNVIKSNDDQASH